MAFPTDPNEPPQRAAASTARLPAHLPDDVRAVLADFCAAAEQSLGDTLESLVLFGSAAEGRLRKTSDVNVLALVRRFDAARIDPLRDALRTAWAAVQLRVMFVLSEELASASETFAVKFHDIHTRRVVLIGADPFARLAIPRPHVIYRLRQVLLDTAIRLRGTYALLSLREEQLARVIAEAAAPLRSSAHALLELEGRPATSPKEAMERLVADLPGSGWPNVLAQLSHARESAQLPPGVGPTLVLRLIDLATAMRERVERL